MTDKITGKEIDRCVYVEKILCLCYVFFIARCRGTALDIWTYPTCGVS